MLRTVFIALCFLNSIQAGQSLFYENLTQTNPFPLSLHFLTVDPTKTTIILEPAHYYGDAETTSSIAKRKNALAAINGGFFDFGQKNIIKYSFIKFFEFFGLSPYYAFPVFCVKVCDSWLSLSNIKGALLGWKKDNAKIAYIDTVATQWHLVFDNNTYLIKNMNKPYAQAPILFTPAFGKRTPLNANVIEIVIDKNIIVEINTSGGNSIIPRYGFVYSIDKQTKPTNFRLYTCANLELKYIGGKSSTPWNTMDFLLGCTPMLLKNGVVTSSLLKKQSPFYNERRPRSALGITAQGNWIFLVADGYQPSSKGLTLLEMAYYLKDKGCISAINLDGDGSSTMVVNHKVVNSPASEYGFIIGKYRERPVANAILILSKMLN